MGTPKVMILSDSPNVVFIFNRIHCSVNERITKTTTLYKQTAQIKLQHKLERR